MALHMKAGDTWPLLDGQLTANGVVTNLTGATVRFVMSTKAGNLVFDHAASIVGDPTLGRVEYVWQSSDTLNAGNYYAEFHITFGDGKKTTLPNDGYMEVEILPALS
jgi:hypothetical protein